MDLFLQFLTGGMVASSLRDCSQVLEILQVLGVDTKNVVLEKKMIKVDKQETTGGEVLRKGKMMKWTLCMKNKVLMLPELKGPAF